MSSSSSSSSSALSASPPDESRDVPGPTLSGVLETLRTKGDEDTTAIKVLEEVVESGSECAVQTLYEGPPKCPCCKNWVVDYPDDLRSSVDQQQETKKKALVLRMGKNHGEGKPLALDSIVVQSRFLKGLLSEVFSDYVGITANLEKLVFKSPFEPFHHRWDLFTELVGQQDSKSENAGAHARLLYNILDIELRDTRLEVDDLVKHGVMTFQKLWALFRPGTQVFSIVENEARLFLLERVAYENVWGSNALRLQLKFIDHDGKDFGIAATSLSIDAYTGTKPITDLTAYPFSFHTSKDETEQSIRARGEGFCRLQGFHYLSYGGTMLWEGKDSWMSGTHRSNISERIVLDAASYSEEMQPLNLSSLDTYKLSPILNVQDDRHQARGPYRRGPYNQPPMPPPPPHPMPMSPYATPPKPPRAQMLMGGEGRIPEWTKRDLEPRQVLLCNSHLRGYALKTKRWGRFLVTGTKPISWNEAAFTNLMLPGGHKDLVLSLIESQISEDALFDDLIEGKGLGVILLLIGNAGTGKTLTAEAVADKVRRPLYVLSAGELGRDASDIEDRLTTVLKITERWNAVLLFDECDVFLQKRSINNFAHNEIVAVFLRLLEYYRGILFMTSNREDAIDPAFQSRTHMTLHYPDLDVAAKRHIWEIFITQWAPDNTIEGSSYEKLSNLPVNGRQIKNTVKMSLLLSVKEKKPLSFHHISTVLHATAKVDVNALGQ
ncbi:P-loop containing nucleoside triphosphate hydrolase protein [Xylariomycetidae sp. FL0641]|nr:P-loop containing nucleoside triphosphate hydrolase protein [Xylariomycetidae sp. FL0641]